MKITKQRLKEIIKEELTKPFKRAPPRALYPAANSADAPKTPQLKISYGVEDDPLITRRGDEEAAEPFNRSRSPPRDNLRTRKFMESGQAMMFFIDAARMGR